MRLCPQKLLNKYITTYSHPHESFKAINVCSTLFTRVAITSHSYIQHIKNLNTKLTRYWKGSPSKHTDQDKQQVNTYATLQPSFISDSLHYYGNIDIGYLK